ncbi:MAG: hypothetical protein J6C23_07910 [Clostridia bacterium]|nr:hypothetical protein [Clostridia bacterium]
MYIYRKSAGRGFHNWTYEEDYICCEMYLKYLSRQDYLRQRIEDFVNLVHSRIPNVKKSSIRMKFQNIQYLVDKYAPYLGKAIASLDQYSDQCLNVFLNLSKKIEI